MSGIDFEYAIKKDVRNNPIVREVDEARQKQLLQSVVIGGFLCLVILFSAWQRFALVGHDFAMQQMQRRCVQRARAVVVLHKLLSDLLVHSQVTASNGGVHAAGIDCS